MHVGQAISPASSAVLPAEFSPETRMLLERDRMELEREIAIAAEERSRAIVPAELPEIVIDRGQPPEVPWPLIAVAIGALLIVGYTYSRQRRTR